VAIDKFVPQGSIDPVFFSGQTYYLVPKGRQAQKPYSVLRRAIVEEKVWGLAQVVISNREQLVVLRPVDRLLAISVLNYANEVRSADVFAKELEDEKPSAQEVKLAKTLIDMSMAKPPELGKYHDLYNDRLAKLVQAKIKGEDVATVPDDDERPAVFDFMAALKASVKEQRPRSPGSKKLYGSALARRSASNKRRKSG
jgi:DNA end-binding protein Ku